jgi:hypothetical protein
MAACPTPKNAAHKASGNTPIPANTSPKIKPTHPKYENVKAALANHSVTPNRYDAINRTAAAQAPVRRTKLNGRSISKQIRKATQATGAKNLNAAKDHIAIVSLIVTPYVWYRESCVYSFIPPHFSTAAPNREVKARE